MGSPDDGSLCIDTKNGACMVLKTCRIKGHFLVVIHIMFTEQVVVVLGKFDTYRCTDVAITMLTIR